MPNYCDYSMRVKGKKENIEEFIEIIKADYNYYTMKFTAKRHLHRVFEADVVNEPDEICDGIYDAIIDGYCAWSVSCCMFDGAHSYYQQLKSEYGDMFRGTTIPIESKRLDLDIEIFSSEPGIQFMEHYIVKKGDIVLEECVDYSEYCLSDYETKEEAEKDLEVEITDEEWNNRDVTNYIERGGIPWEFEI